MILVERVKARRRRQNHRAMKTALSIVGACLCIATTGRGQAQPDVDACKADQQNLASIAGRASSLPPLAQFKNLIQFLNALQDDPTDCVSSAATDRIRKAERRLVALEVGGQTIEPDWIFHCNEIDKPSAWCTGGELDTSALLPEEGLGSRLARAPPTRARSAKLHMQEGYPCKVIGIYASSTTAVQAGKPPVTVAYHGMIIETGRLPAKNPVLIVALRCEDKLRYRKAIWHLY
jgi:hypothetical protein